MPQPPKRSVRHKATGKYAKQFTRTELNKAKHVARSNGGKRTAVVKHPKAGKKAPRG